MDFPRAVDALNATVNVDQAQAFIRATYGRHASRWLASEAGISPRTARRWLSSSAPRSRAGAIVEAARQSTTPYGIVAAQLRGIAQTGGTISVGHITVVYDGEDEGSRFVNDLTVDDWMAEDLLAAADALDRGDLASAADAFSDAVIGGYSHGLEDTLSVSDYPDGIQLA